MRCSIVITSYNYAGFVGRAISSALDQQVPPHQVIVVDDGSTDGSWDVIAGFGERITAVRQENAGAFAALSAGYARCTGEVVIALDSDDELTPCAIARHLAVFAADPGCVVSQGRMRCIDAEGRDLGEDHFDRPWLTGDLSRMLLRDGRIDVWPFTSGNAWRRSFIEAALALRPRMAISDDGFFHSVAAFHGSYGDAGAVVARYRIHGRNYSAAYLDDPHRLGVIVGEEFEKLHCLVRAAEGFGHRCSVAGIIAGSLKLTRNFLAWDRLGAPWPDGMPRVGMLAAWRTTLAAMPRQEAFRQAAWLLAVAVAPAGMRRRLLRRVVTLVAGRLAPGG